MILIADSGSTKTDWVLLENTNSSFIFTKGINAYYMTSEHIGEMLQAELLPQVSANKVNAVFFYGSGCSTEAKCAKIGSILKSLFPNAQVEVNHDMFAAARALCDNKPGIACILGTGSNSCVYDGHSITRQMVSLGYFFGDEGSGTHLGKLLITDYLKDEMPDDIAEKLTDQHNLSLEYILDCIYNSNAPNKFLASFAPFIQENYRHPYIKQLVTNSFDDFFKVGIMRFTGYQQMEVNFAGSIAFHFKDILLEVGKKHNLKINRIQKSVIEGLRDYHSGHSIVSH